MEKEMGCEVEEDEGEEVGWWWGQGECGTGGWWECEW